MNPREIAVICIVLGVLVASLDEWRSKKGPKA